MARNLINRLKNYWLELFIILLGSVHQVLQKLFLVQLTWFDHYGDDLLAVPFVSSCVLLMENILVYKNHQRKHSFGQLLFLFLAISVFFECIAPRYSSKYFYDPIDFVYYFIGFISFYWIQKKSRGKSSRL